ncbi:transcriptional regulator NrdR [Candidatus Aerophobetes bacterium]|uniref:Transcriptional repressor NrdR n=1 Tax=Aerophobetes bacterium TaxID=2030807 RepID=A0A2A4X1Q8_UNCAE|nr:MAG: transcriptional regulator NrdR [Candidatus Aerophobetes bacterium]
MKCPFCTHDESKVTDSRTSIENNSIRRRRECLKCGKRFTTFEAVDICLQVRKRDGSYQNFDLNKLIKGVDMAARHTKISHDQVRELATSIAVKLGERQSREIDALDLGEMVMQELIELDPVAYVRFACVYRRFTDVHQIKDILSHTQS